MQNPVRSTSRIQSGVWVVPLAVLIAIGVAGFARAWMGQQAARQIARTRLASHLPKESDDRADFVSSNRCAACHPSEHASWHRTYHRTMTQKALPGNVAGQFDGSKIQSHGMVYEVFRKGDEYWARMPDPDLLMYTVQGGKRIDEFHYWVKRSKESPLEKVDLRKTPIVERQVVMTTGSHHYQTYWVPGDPKFGNLLQTLPLVYLIKEQKWIPREEAFMNPPNSIHLVTQWNHHCIRCHSTEGNPGLLDTTGGFDTSVGELGISCEACHGPGGPHERANRDPLRRFQLHQADKGDPTIVNPARLDHVASSQVCGQCHGVYVTRDEYSMRVAKEGPLYRPGDDLFRTRYYIQHPVNEPTLERQRDMQRNPDFFRERWWDDGTVLAGGREFTAMSATACYQKGTISCLSCHSMHGSDPADQVSEMGRGNRACTQCHQQPEYTTELNRHTHHAVDSAGSECMNCHMPHTTYALFGALRSHQISVPTVLSSARYGTPNACNLCHLDQTLAWTQEQLGAWYGTPPVPLTEEQKNISAALLWLIKGHAAQRAIAAWHMGWEPAWKAAGSDWLAPFTAQLLTDSYGVVRFVAAGALRKLPSMDTINYDFLADPPRLQAASDEAVKLWRNQWRSSGSRGPRVLMDPSGQLDELRLRQLLQQRDDRAVTIKE